MSGAVVKIKIDGQERVEAALSGLARRAADLRQALADIGEYLMLAHQVGLGNGLKAPATRHPSPSFNEAEAVGPRKWAPL